jgi:hypothetical protein
MTGRGEIARGYSLEVGITGTVMTTENKGITPLFPRTLVTVSNGK